MKMVAAAKMRKDTRAMEVGLPFAMPAQKLMERVAREDTPGSVLYLAITSDKGLCGGVNSAVNKQIRLGVNEEEAKGNACKVTVMGGKGVAGLKRLYGDRFGTSFEDIAKAPWNFAASSIIAERVIAAKPERLKVVSNTFKSMV